MTTKTTLFVSLIIFWTCLTITSNYFYEDTQVSILKNSPTELLSDTIDTTPQEENSFLSGLFNTLDEIPVINYFTPLLKIMSFQYTDEIPSIVSIFLSMFSIFSVYVIFTTIKGD